MSNVAAPFSLPSAIWRPATMAAVLYVLAGCGSPGRVATDNADSAADLGVELVTVRARALAEPEVAYWPYREAELLVAADSLESAQAALQKSLALDPHHAASLSLISKLDYDAGRHRVAIARLEAAARDFTLPTELQLALGLHYEAAGDFDASDSLFSSVRSDHNSVAYYALRSDDLERARDAAERSLEAEPRSAAAHNDFGITRLYAGDPSGAREHFLKALDLDAHHLGAIYNLSVLDTFYLLDEAKGRQWFDRYRELGGDDDPDRLGEHFSVEADPIGKQARR